jgi:hypothetical protein
MSGKQNAQGKSSSAPAQGRSIAEIEADIATSRENLLASIEQLESAVKETVNPRRVIYVQLGRVRAFYIDEYGGVRPERVAATVGVVVGVFVAGKISRSIFR